MGPIEKLVLCSIAMLTLPIGGFFGSKTFVFEGKLTPLNKISLGSSFFFYIGVLGYPDGSVGGAIVAVILVHCVIAGFVYTAWMEGQTPTPIKKD